jgi:CubicO group peptidase (beta-lactamase class C family)
MLRHVQGGLVKLTLIFAIVALLALGTAAKSPAQSSDTSQDKKTDAVFSEVTSPDAPGLAVLVRKNGSTIFERGYGVRDLRSKTKIDARTNFRLASFTKQFTAMAIMLLVHDGKLRYEQMLTEIFPDFPAYGKTITVRNLLNHTSGLLDYEDLMENVFPYKHDTPDFAGALPPDSLLPQIQDAEVLAHLKQQTTTKFAPGTSWAYSNSGYVVLGLIVSKISGKSYRGFLRERIFAPLKMNGTIVFQKGENEVADRAFGHSKVNGAFKETDQSPTSATLGDGGIYSNLEDLAKWDDALRNHTLLSEKEMQPALTPVKLADGSEPRWPVEANDDNLHPGNPVSYGFGWFLDPYPTHGHAYQRKWHTGSTIGFRTVIERFTEGEGLTAIVLCNRTDLVPEKLALQVADVFLSTKN